MNWNNAGKDKKVLDQIRHGDSSSGVKDSLSLSKHEYEAALQRVTKDLEYLAKANERYLQVNIEKLLKMLESLAEEESYTH